MPSAAWARVRILLNLGDVAQATTEAVRAAKLTIWCEEPLQVGGPPIHAVAEMPAGWAFLDPGVPQLAVLNTDVVDEFAMSVCMFQFVRVCSDLSGPAMRFYDIENWRLLDGMDDAEHAEREGRS
jgi:hypothetical protein